MFGPKRDKSFTYAKFSVDSLSLDGKKVAVIGGTDGLGRAIARLAAERGAEVTVVGRTYRDPPTDRITFAKSDLSLMREAKHLGESDALSPDLDILLFTNGIIAASNREVTREGIERDMAVSYLSRLAVLNAYLPRLKEAQNTSAPLRIFVMGFPGAGQAGKLGDLNAEKSYSAIGVHMQTVAGNEALVVHLNDKTAEGVAAAAAGAAERSGRPVEAYGLNPGLIKTRIRENFTGTGLLARAMEWVIGATSITPEAYAKRIVPLLVAPELSTKPGLLFNQAADAIKPTPAMTDMRHVAAFIAESQGLINRGLAADLAPA